MPSPDHGSSATGRQTLLIDWVFYPPIGHALEGLKFAGGCAQANPELDIHLLVTKSRASRLLTGLGWLRVHEIKVPDRNRTLFTPIPRSILNRDWDYVIHTPLSANLRAGDDWSSLLRARRLLDGLSARRGAGVAPSVGGAVNLLPIPYRANSRVTLAPAASARDKIARTLARYGSGPHICILPSGSTAAQAPSLDAWQSVVHRLAADHPRATFHLTGRSGRFGSTSAGYSAAEIRRLGSLGQVELWWNASPETQLALFAACDLLVSPHTSFSFLASLVDTPWLTLSACKWPEYFFNYVPFHSVLPDCGAYPSLDDPRNGPCHGLISAGERPVCLQTSLIEAKLDEIADVAGRLIHGQISYEEAMTDHLARVDSHPGVSRFSFFDGRESLMQSPIPLAGSGGRL